MSDANGSVCYGYFQNTAALCRMAAGSTASAPSQGAHKCVCDDRHSSYDCEILPQLHLLQSLLVNCSNR